jgi:hypothetical protein
MLTVIQGLIVVIDSPLRQSFLFEMVGKEDLVNAFKLNSMPFQEPGIFDPALVGVVIKFIGIAPTVIFNAISFIAVICSLVLIDAKAPFLTLPGVSLDLQQSDTRGDHRPYCQF